MYSGIVFYKNNKFTVKIEETTLTLCKVLKSEPLTLEPLPESIKIESCKILPKHSWQHTEHYKIRDKTAIGTDYNELTTPESQLKRLKSVAIEKLTHFDILNKYC